MIRALLAATAIAAAAINAVPSPVAFADECQDGYYWSKTAGSCVPVPAQASTPPSGSTFQCADGTYSFSKTSHGACSRHGGIDQSL
jgi:hypothetical protein